MLVIVSSSPLMWGSLFISTNIPDLQHWPRTVELFQTSVCLSYRPIFRHGCALFVMMLSAKHFDFMQVSFCSKLAQKGSFRTFFATRPYQIRNIGLRKEDCIVG